MVMNIYIYIYREREREREGGREAPEHISREEVACGRGKVLCPSTTTMLHPFNTDEDYDQHDGFHFLTNWSMKSGNPHHISVFINM